MRRLPYRAVRCPDCKPEDNDCESCGGCHRIIERVEELSALREAIAHYIAKARAYRGAWGHK